LSQHLEAIGQRLDQDSRQDSDQSSSDERSLPPVHLWQPKLNGDMDMRIAADGRWFHQGDEIKRLKLVKLFASILKREGDDVFLVTPVEKWRIKIDREVFCLNQFEWVEGKAGSAIVFSSELGERAELNADNPIYFNREDQQDIPCIKVRSGLNASLSRSVFYQLVELGSEQDGQLVIESAGASFTLGSLE